MQIDIFPEKNNYPEQNILKENLSIPNQESQEETFMKSCMISFNETVKEMRFEIENYLDKMIREHIQSTSEEFKNIKNFYMVSCRNRFKHYKKSLNRFFNNTTKKYEEQLLEKYNNSLMLHRQEMYKKYMSLQNKGFDAKSNSEGNHFIFNPYGDGNIYHNLTNEIDFNALCTHLHNHTCTHNYANTHTNNHINFNFN